MHISGSAGFIGTDVTDRPAIACTGAYQLLTENDSEGI